VKRRIVLILIFLLAGAVVNVAVAWGCVVFYTDNSTMILPEGEFDSDDWPSPPPTGFSFNPTTIEVETATGVDYLVLGTSWNAGTLVRPAFAIFLQVGWPCRTARGEVWVRRDQDESGNYLPTRRFLRGVLDARIKDILPPLPYIPLWTGFAFNTVFYAAILWLLIPGPFALRRLVRRRRGLCPACGYDLKHAEHESCPECGGGLKKPAAA
jgi:hypothetical protein